MHALENRPIGFKPKHMTVAQYRIAEMDLDGDFGTAYTKAPFYITHHSSCALERADQVVRCWSNPNNLKGRANLHKTSVEVVKAFRERIDPVLYGLEKELDPNRAARTAYEAIEDNAFAAINRLFLPATTASVPRSRLRIQQISGIHEVLSEFARDYAAWVSELAILSNCRALGDS